MKSLFKVGQCPENIYQNHWAWASNVAEFRNKKDAEDYANSLWTALLKAADEAGTNYVGQKIITNY